MQRLPRMAGIRLLDGDDVEHARTARLVPPHALHARQPGALDLVPDHAGFHDALRIRKIRWRDHRTCKAEDRVVAVIDALDAHHRLPAAPAGVVAGELAERALGHRVAGMHLALEHDLGVRRHRQAVHLALDDFVRRAAMAGRVVVLGKAVADLVAAGEEEQRIVTARDEHWAWLARAPIFLPNLATVLARRDPQADAIRALHHRAVGRAVHPAFVRLAH